MKSKAKLLAIVGSQRKNGNSYLLAESVLESVGTDYEIIQLAEKNIEYCTLCEQCTEKDCVLEDDFEQILKKIRKADGIIFVFPKYLFVGSKFLAFLERLDTICHMRRHKGYEHACGAPDYKLFPNEKPSCILALSGTGKIEKETLRIVAGYIEFLGLKLVSHGQPPLSWVSIKAGDRKGEVLKNKEAMEQCKKLIEKLVKSIKK